MIIPENLLFPLDPSGATLQGKVPAYVTRQILARYGPSIKSSREKLSHWFLTEETTTATELHTWIGDRDFFESIYLLPPGSHLWIDAESHSLDSVQASPMPDPDWPVRDNEMWMFKRVRITTEDIQEAHAIWGTRSLIVEENGGSHSSAPTGTSLQQMQWYKDAARSLYQERMGEQDIIHQIAKNLSPSDVTDCLELLVNNPALMTKKLQGSHVHLTIMQIISLYIYESLVTFLEEECLPS
jgi:hypothetical protein